jgi:hypothetical protein
MLLSEWLAHTPPDVLAKNTGLDPSVFAKAPHYIFPGTVPGSLEQDKAEIGGEGCRIPLSVHLQDEVDGTDEDQQERLSTYCRFPEFSSVEAYRCSIGRSKAG